MVDIGEGGSLVEKIHALSLQGRSAGNDFQRKQAERAIRNLVHPVSPGHLPEDPRGLSADPLVGQRVNQTA